MRIVRRPSFDRDLATAYAYYRDRGISVADAFRRRIDEAVLGLKTLPMSGTPRDDLRPGIRSIVVRQFGYLLFYSVDEGEIRLIRAIHGARDLPSVLRED